MKFKDISNFVVFFIYKDLIIFKHKIIKLKQIL